MRDKKPQKKRIRKTNKNDGKTDQNDTVFGLYFLIILYLYHMSHFTSDSIQDDNVEMSNISHFFCKQDSEYCAWQRQNHLKMRSVRRVRRP